MNIQRSLNERGRPGRLMAYLTRFVLALMCMCASPPTLAAPPGHSKWHLTFADDFSADSVDLNVWQVEAASPPHIASSRWPENISFKVGHLALVTRKEYRGGKEWTTAHLWTQSFRQRYGYFEARLKIASAKGLNNAFWLTTAPERRCEIDIVEAHYPSSVWTDIHKWVPMHVHAARRWDSASDLSADFHLYAVEWNDQELRWYFDGKLIAKRANLFCHEPVVVALSTAVLLPLQPSDELNEKSMLVDYVRAYAED
jgi:beta-glucanase (GH16 family)